MEIHFTDFGRILEWLEIVAASQQRADDQRAMLNKIEEWVQAQLRVELERKPARPEVVAAVDAVLAAGWSSPASEFLTDESLIAAEREIERLWQEHDRLYDDLEQRGLLTGEDEDVVNRLWDRADDLTELALEASVSTMRGARAMLQLLRRHAFEREIDAWQERYPAAMDRVLALLDRQAGVPEGRPDSQ